MEEKELVICDTDVLIEFIDRNNEKVKQRLERVGFRYISASAITAAELLVGSKNKRHQEKLQKFVSSLVIIPLTIEITDVFLVLVKKYSLSHGLKIQDAIIAATALVFDIPLYTLNAKDFKFIKGLRFLS